MAARKRREGERFVVYRESLRREAKRNKNKQPRMLWVACKLVKYDVGEGFKVKSFWQIDPVNGTYNRKLHGEFK